MAPEESAGPRVLTSRTDRQAPAADSVSVTGDLDDGALDGDIFLNKTLKFKKKNQSSIER